jgi:5-(carboxyamino)imidazole ribonucleotide mutase
MARTVIVKGYGLIVDSSNYENYQIPPLISLFCSSFVKNDSDYFGKLNENQAPKPLFKAPDDVIMPLFTTYRSMTPLVGIIMGSISDWETMQHAAQILTDFKVSHETRVVSAHRTPDLMAEYAKSAAGRGLKCIIAGAGGAAHLPGMTASFTTLPVLGVPVESRTMKGIDSLYSIVQMPAGIPVATFAIGKAGATNAALFAVSLLAGSDPALAAKLEEFRETQRAKVLATQAELPPSLS